MDPAVLDSLPPDLQSVLWSLAFDIAIVAVAVVAILTTAKHVGAILHRRDARCLDLPWVKVGLEIAPIVLGPVIAIIPGLFDSFGIELQAVFGLIAGYMSPGIYGHLKRRLPGVMMSSESKTRKAGKEGEDG